MRPPFRCEDRKVGITFAWLEKVNSWAPEIINKLVGWIGCLLWHQWCWNTCPRLPSYFRVAEQYAELTVYVLGNGIITSKGAPTNPRISKIRSKYRSCSCSGVVSAPLSGKIFITIYRLCYLWIPCWKDTVNNKASVGTGLMICACAFTLLLPCLVQLNWMYNRNAEQASTWALKYRK